ncbi:MAG TPA: nuclear transport factor 2 family protein [Acidimicrobiales bacterium]|nr:nuclear transport factor 2 family protein [Acidimicrobiales bacterium]
MTITDNERRAANREVVGAVLASITAGTFDRLAEYVTDDLLFDLPYGPDFMPNPIHGREAWNKMQLMTFELFSSFKQTLLEMHDCLDPDELVAEYQSDAVVKRNGNAYTNRYIGVFRFRDGKISQWREYHNPEATKVI